MTIDWRRLFDEKGVEYVEVGPNVKRGNINVHCPFCGAGDPSHHLGINLETGYWGCWRSSDHRGRSPIRLLTNLLHISPSQASLIAGQASQPYIDDFASKMQQIFLPLREDPKHSKHLELPQEFRYILPFGGTRKFFDWLHQERGFRRQDIEVLASNYGLYCALQGEYKDRVIFTATLDGELVTWTGRALGPALVRYKSLEDEKSVVTSRRLLYNFDKVRNGGRALIVTEGPIDVLKLDFYGESNGVRSVGLFTMSITEDQILLLEELVPLYKDVFVMLDADDKNNDLSAMKIAAQIPGANVKVLKVPYNKKDAGELSPSEVKLFTSQAARKWEVHA